jgi:hypothetical protein
MATRTLCDCDLCEKEFVSDGTKRTLELRFGNMTVVELVLCPPCAKGEVERHTKAAMRSDLAKEVKDYPEYLRKAR